MKKAASNDGLTPSQLITDHIAELADWRGKSLARLRKLILAADPAIVEEWNDPHGLFNAGLEAKATRAIDLHEGDKINEPALKELIRAAAALNTSGGKKK